MLCPLAPYHNIILSTYYLGKEYFSSCTLIRYVRIARTAIMVVSMFFSMYRRLRVYLLDLYQLFTFYLYIAHLLLEFFELKILENMCRLFI